MPRVPFGYTREGGSLEPIPEDLNLLHEVAEYVADGSYSLREARDHINAFSTRPISHEGLKKRLLRDNLLKDSLLTNG